MNTRTLLIAVRAASLICAPLMGSPAGAAAPTPPATPKLTLIRLDLAPLDAPSVATLATENCVALVKAGEFAAAGRPCDSAIMAAERESSESRTGPVWSHGSDEGVAATYNNWAVLRYFSGRLELAAADASRANFRARSEATRNTAAAIDAARTRSLAGAE